MAFQYHTPQVKVPFKDPNAIENSVRGKLRKREQSHWGSWALTLAAIIIGAVGGSQLAGISTQDIIRASSPFASNVQPAAGMPERADSTLRLQVAGDGQYYADVELMGSMVTMQFDPTRADSTLSPKDYVAMPDAPQIVGNIAIVPRLELSDLPLSNAAFVVASDNLDYSVIGRDIMAQWGTLEADRSELRIRPVF